MNKVIMMGRLTRDPEVRYNNNADGTQMCIARYTLAVDRRGKAQEGQQGADFIRCIAFGKIGEFTEKYLHQGTKILVEGRIQTGNYTNKDGQKVYTTDVVVENQEFAESKSSQGNAQNQQPATPSPVGDGFMNVPDGMDSGLPFGSQQSQPAAPSSPAGDGFMNIPDGVEDSGLPFNY